MSNKKTKELRSLKRINYANLSDKDSLKNELEILKKADNPNIINIYDVFTTGKSFDIVMEYCKGGSLLDRINKLLSHDKCFSEQEAAIILRQILSALNYGHKNGIVHRDIKLENIMFLDDDPNNFRIKLIDFGLSKFFEHGIKSMKEKLGTCYYVSPEILSGNYNEKCDIWAFGVLFYILLIGVPPFGGDLDIPDEVIYKKVRNYEWSFNNKCMRFVYIFKIIFYRYL